jgi:hypothetical protein
MPSGKKIEDFGGASSHHYLGSKCSEGSVSSRDDQDIVCKLEGSRNIYISATDNFEDISRFTIH